MASTPTLAVFMGLFSGSDEPDLEAIATRLGARPTEDDVLRTLEDLTESLDRLASAADIAGPDGRVANDAPPAEKASELATLVEQGRLRIERGRDGHDRGRDGESAVVSTAAEEVVRSRHPAGHRAASLLDVLRTASDAGRSEVITTLDTVVHRLEHADDVERAVEPDDPERTAARLEGVDSPLAQTVRDLALEAADATEEDERDELDDVRIAVDRALRGVDDVSVDASTPLAERIEALAKAAATDQRPDATPAGAAARRVRDDNRAECDPARDLLDGVASDDPADIERGLRRAVDALNEAATVRNLTDDVDRGAVAARVDSLTQSLESVDGPVAETLRDRVDRLEGMLDRADESNPVVPYTVREEVAFYERDLLPTLESHGTPTDADTSDGHSDASSAVEALSERRSALRSQYVDQRTDHNHSIPMFFLSLTETLESEARDALQTGEPDRARGLIEATDELFDRIEGLYERNEYSVMLRRLRG